MVTEKEGGSVAFKRIFVRSTVLAASYAIIYHFLRIAARIAEIFTICETSPVETEDSKCLIHGLDVHESRV